MLLTMITDHFIDYLFQHKRTDLIVRNKSWQNLLRLLHVNLDISLVCIFHNNVKCVIFILYI